MANNQYGKTVIIFTILFMVLLVSATSIGFFLYNKERQTRIFVEQERDAARETINKLQADLKEVRHQVTVLEDKNKEADEKINNLLDDAELNKGVRDSLKKDNSSLKEALETAQKEKEKIRQDLDGMQTAMSALQKKLTEEKDRSKQLQEEIEQVRNQQSEPMAPTAKSAAKLESVELNKIVVNPQEGIKGRILSVDKDTEFIVCNLGIKQGVKFGDILSVYRGEEYLGDVKVSRVQDEISAADLIPPFSSSKVRKNDIVVVKI